MSTVRVGGSEISMVINRESQSFSWSSVNLLFPIAAISASINKNFCASSECRRALSFQAKTRPGKVEIATNKPAIDLAWAEGTRELNAAVPAIKEPALDSLSQSAKKRSLLRW